MTEAQAIHLDELVDKMENLQMDLYLLEERSKHHYECIMYEKQHYFGGLTQDYYVEVEMQRYEDEAEFLKDEIEEVREEILTLDSEFFLTY